MTKPLVPKKITKIKGNESYTPESLCDIVFFRLKKLIKEYHSENPAGNKKNFLSFQKSWMWVSLCAGLGNKKLIWKVLKRLQDKKKILIHPYSGIEILGTSTDANMTGDKSG